MCYPDVLFRIDLCTTEFLPSAKGLLRFQYIQVQSQDSLGLFERKRSSVTDAGEYITWM